MTEYSVRFHDFRNHRKWPLRLRIKRLGDRKRGYLARTRFDGEHGVPKHCLYLALNGMWKDSIREAHLFETKEEAQAFLALRLKSQGRWGELHRLAIWAALHDVKVGATFLEECPTFAEELEKGRLTWKE